MKNNIRRLQILTKIFGCDHFYDCDATNYATSCLGRFNSEVLLKALKYKFILTVSGNGFITLTRGCYNIILTD